MGKLRAWLILPFLVIALSACSGQPAAKIQLTGMKTAMGVDDKYMPVNVADVFPDGTTKVFCWFSWKDAEKDVKILAKWHYVTDDIHVLDYTFAIPRKEGMGSVSLAMPQGKVLPAGLYRVTLGVNKKELRVLAFKVSEKS